MRAGGRDGFGSNTGLLKISVALTKCCQPLEDVGLIEQLGLTGQQWILCNADSGQRLQESLVWPADVSPSWDGMGREGKGRENIVSHQEFSAPIEPA
jgi:hypothetical protein